MSKYKDALGRPKYKELYWRQVGHSNAQAKTITELRTKIECGQYPGANVESMMREIEQLRETVNDLLEKNRKLEAALLGGEVK